MGTELQQQGPPEAVVERILAGLAEGRSMRSICAGDGLPDRVTVWRWAQGDDELGARIREAREAGFEMRAERAVDAAKRATDPIAGRLAFDAERWYLGKLSNAFAEKPIAIGALVNVDAGDAFGTFAQALEGAAAAKSSLAHRTSRVAIEGEARPVDPAGGLAGVAGVGGPGMGEDPHGG